jgi:hypothetical protein
MGTEDRPAIEPGRPEVHRPVAALSPEQVGQRREQIHPQEEGKYFKHYEILAH